MILKSYKLANSLKNPLFHLFLLIIGISIGLVSALCLKTFVSFTFPSFSRTPPPPLPEPPPPPPPPPPPAQTITSNCNITLMTKTTTSLVHNMSDDELLERASRVSSQVESEKFVPKVAFMFLTPGPLPLSPLWDMFFEGHHGMYSIYVHPHPSYNESLPTTSAFCGRRIPSQPVYWGTMSMIDAERRLLANALLDTHNQRFVLLSDSCIPLFNFTTVYNHLMGTNHSFLGSFDDPRKMGRGRYNRRMWPTITVEQWRKGSQWFEIHRDLAVKIVSDKTYYQVFHEFCHPPCYNDEHYLPTLVNILSAEENSNRSVTWVDWPRDGPHPRKFGWVDVNVELLHRIRFGSECRYNGNVTNVCHLFARKFLPSTLRVLLKVAPLVLGFGS
ncbi:Glycosyltransferase BC10 [Sesamum alatum]|uniref:Glycosyltransferase BC10 n=1 Tax=Sesamum alatum TaxID=300844 RepID=A0AAE1YAI3_9LAMI|nr:Glycosyltransferase BC10 [Sesamum alatum]